MDTDQKNSVVFSGATQDRNVIVDSLLDGIGPEYLQTRQFEQRDAYYINVTAAIALANEVLGEESWCYSVISEIIDFVDKADNGYHWECGATAVVRVTFASDPIVFREDIGYGISRGNTKKTDAEHHALNIARNDALKRALRLFGPALGNCLYDNSWSSWMRCKGWTNFRK